MNSATDRAEMNFNWLLDNKVAGCSGPKSDGDLEFLVAEGVKAIVRLADTHEARITTAQVTRAGLVDYHEPVRDFAVPTIDQAVNASGFVGKMVREAHPVVVTCGAGKGRTGTILACYLVDRGFPAQDAIDVVRRIRPGSVEGLEQEKFVFRYEKKRSSAFVKPSPKEVAENLRIMYHLDAKTSFEPGIWFSYGSNLDKEYFEEKMLKKESSLKLIDPKTAILDDYVRKLDNRSSGHGLGYEVHEKSGCQVAGIVHKVPLNHLIPFLRMEGVLGGDHRMMEDRSYDIIERPVRSGATKTKALILVGNRRKANELNEYVRASLKGARKFGADPTQFERDLEWTKSLL